jgi:hypothetical protein
MRDNGGMLDTHPRQKIGRNAPCPCGSGKKYKHCCLREAETARDHSPWRKQHEASDRLTGEMMRFAASNFDDCLLEAWQDFNQETFPQTMDKFPGEEQIFMPFFLFDWDPERPPRSRRKRRHPGIVARTFLEERGIRLGELEAAILGLSIEAPLSFYEVLDCEPGFGMRIRDVLMGGEAEVEEHTASRTVQVGSILYGQLCRLPDVTAFSRLAPIALRPDRKVELVNLRASLRTKAAKQKRPLSEVDLIEHEEKIRIEYLNARDAMYAPVKLTNTDGEPILLQTLRFRVGSAQVAFDALAPLAWNETREDLLEAAEFAPDASMLSAEIRWTKRGNATHKSWDNTILGHIKIKGRTLTVDVNSATRAERIRKEIDKRLGILAVHEGTETHTQEEMMESARRKGNKRGRMDAKAEIEEPGPEQMEIVENMLREHAEAWVDTKIPTLGGRTPRQAIQDADGRGSVEGLLLEWEQRNRDSRDPALRGFDVGFVRRKLGM